jgi:aspartyl-tRNA(Asn)/glutamyl-tRNA(Gln) amidotransferase subunit B
VGVLVGLGSEGIAYFDEAARTSGDAKAACNWVTNQVLAAMKETQAPSFPVPAARLGELIVVQKEMGLSKQAAAEVFAKMREGLSAREAVSALGLSAVDDSAVAEMVRRAMLTNPKAVQDYRKGKTAAANAIKGAVMKEARGAVRADVVERVLKEELERE